MLTSDRRLRTVLPLLIFYVTETLQHVNCFTDTQFITPLSGIITLLLVCICMYSGPGSSVGIATELPGWTVRDRIPEGTRFSARPDRPWGPPSLLQSWYRVFPGGKVRPGRDADHSPPSSAAV